MTIKVKYFLFIGIIHLVLTFLVFYLLRDQKFYLFPAEVALLFSLFLSYRIYQEFIRPLQFIATGTDAIRDQDFNVKFNTTGSREMDKLIAVYNDMIDNIREERIQTQEQHYFMQKLINASPAGIIILNYDDQIAEINPQACEMLGIDAQSVMLQVLNQHPHPILNKLHQIEVGTSQIVAGRGIEQFKCQVSRFVHRGFQRKFVILQELSKEILEAEKRAYGKVIRMMAHEVNNSIGAINSILHSLLELYSPQIKQEKQDFEHSLGVAIVRNERLNQFMKNFAEVVRLPAPHLESIALNPLLRNLGHLMEAQAKQRNVRLTWALSEEEVYITADTQQIEQLLVNVIKNALESIHENGIIQISTTHQPKTLVIADDGAGIAPEVAERLFTPFFSTKAEGQGVGLTLVREILLNHGAQFSLKTEADGWTRFRVLWT